MSSLLLFIFLFFREEFPVKKKQHQHPDGDVGVRQIEYRAEENEMFTPPYRQPRWEMPLDEREIEHVDDPSVQEGSIPAFFREQRGHLVKTAVEDQTVEQAVDDVPDGTAADHRESAQHPRGRMALEQPGDIPADDPHGGDAEEAQEHLPELPLPEFHAERHAVVFHEEKAEPVEHHDFFPQHQVGLDPYLYRLVDKQQNGGEQNKLIAKIHTARYAFPVSFASTLNVA